MGGNQFEMHSLEHQMDHSGGGRIVNKSENITKHRPTIPHQNQTIQNHKHQIGHSTLEPIRPSLGALGMIRKHQRVPQRLLELPRPHRAPGAMEARVSAALKRCYQK